jgi:hypothetical protein
MPLHSLQMMCWPEPTAVRGVCNKQIAPRLFGAQSPSSGRWQSAYVPFLAASELNGFHWTCERKNSTTVVDMAACCKCSMHGGSRNIVQEKPSGPAFHFDCIVYQTTLQLAFNGFFALLAWANEQSPWTRGTSSLACSHHSVHHRLRH